MSFDNLLVKLFKEECKFIFQESMFVIFASYINEHDCQMFLFRAILYKIRYSGFLLAIERSH